MATDRVPYVGEGEDGARRTANIYREELDTIDWNDPRRDEVIAHAESWEQQARELMYQRLGRRPTLAQVHASVGSEEWLAALALVNLSTDLRTDLAQWTDWADHSGHYTYEGDTQTFHPDPYIEWEAWAADVDEQGRGWSSTAWRAYELVTGLTIKGRTVNLTVLAGLGSWEQDALRILVNWATGGNNRDRSGRYSIVPN